MQELWTCQDLGSLINSPVIYQPVEEDGLSKLLKTKSGARKTVPAPNVQELSV